jgi:nicotinate-nucleotide adenylyltransferase
MGKGSQSKTKRLGFFGGSFDPIHIGHISLAKQAIKQAQLDKLLLCPAFHAPLRDQIPFFSPDIRLQILEKVAAEHSKIEICSFEIEKQKVCFTFDTLCEVQKIYPTSEIIVLLGADQFNQLEKWKYHTQLAQAFQFCVFARDSSQISPPSIPNLSFNLMQNKLIHCSSSEIRENLKNGKSIKNLVPSSVYSIISQKSIPS